MRTVLLAAVLALGGQQSPADTSVLSGRVLRVGTSSPVAKPQVSLIRLHSDLPQTDAALEAAQNVASVLLRPEASTPAFVEGFLFSTASRAGVSAEILRPLSTALAETDDSGSFTFRTLLPGRYTLAVQREGYF